MIKPLTPEQVEMDRLVSYFMRDGDLTKAPLKVVVLTGAGVSTDSGLPDFRGRAGIWRGGDLDVLLTADGAAQRFDEFTAFCKLALREVLAHKPNITHRILAELQQAGLVGTIITQNVDYYHQAAGATDVIEAHGCIRDIYCASCGIVADVESYLVDDGERCDTCGGRRRPRIVLSGEALSGAALSNAIEAIAQTDLLIAMGTTLEVAPVSLAPGIVKQNGGRFAIFNGEAIAMGDIADYSVYGPLADAANSLYGYVVKYDRKRHQLPSSKEIASR